MRAIILAAGKGKRLGEVADEIPKPMIKIGGKPILLHNILWLKSEGITELYINLHHRPDVIKNYFGDGSRWGVKIHYSYEPEILGTSGAVKKIADGWQESFLVVYGDNFFKSGFGLEEFIKFHSEKNVAATVGVYRPGGNLSEKGVVVLDKAGRVLEFLEKPERPPSDLVSAGLYVLSPEAIGMIPEGISDFGHDIFPAMLRGNKPIFGFVFRGELIAVDTSELYKKVLDKHNSR